MGAMTNPAFPTASGPITLEGPEGPLEAHVDWPEDGEPVKPVTAVICHPLPTEGGTMHTIGLIGGMSWVELKGAFRRQR